MKSSVIFYVSLPFKAVNELIPLLAKLNLTIDNHHHSILDGISEVSSITSFLVEVFERELHSKVSWISLLTF